MHYTKIICSGRDYLRNFYPDATDLQLDRLIRLLECWMSAVVELDSIKRLKFLLGSGTDFRGIRREVLSPRKQIVEFMPWVCFEAEMRIKIWASQHQTYLDLTRSTNRSYSQLNMGEGKTQVIIPMLVLEKVYNAKPVKRRLPRINLLSSLLDESRRNYFRFFSATSFRLPCLEIPFNRTVALSEQNLRSVKEAISNFMPRCVVICDREATLSMTLKFRELNELAHNAGTRLSEYLREEKESWLFGEQKVFDILD